MRNRIQRVTNGLAVAAVAALLLSCNSPEVRRGNRMADQGEWDKAVAAYRDALKKEPFSEDIQISLDRAKVHAAEGHFTEGRRHLREGHLPDAIREYKVALGLDPSKAEYQAGLSDALRMKEARDQLAAAEKFVGLGRPEEAMAAYERSVELDPTLTQGLEGITQLTKQQRAMKAIGAMTQPISLRFQNAKLKEVFEILARTAGINVIFDKEVRDDPVTIFIKDLPFDEALNLILNTNSMVAQRVAPDTILVMPNNKQKQAQYQDLLMRTFYLSNTKAKEAVNLVRTMLDSKKIYVDEKVNAIVVRDEPAKLQLAERLLFAIDRREPEVELDLEVLEINRTKNLKYGVNFAKQLGSGLVPPGTTGAISTATTQFTYRQLTSLGPDSYIFTIPASVLVDFFKQDSDAKTLASPKLRVLNNRSATINIGDKQPILLSTTNVLPGQAATGAVPTTSTVTSIEFKDVGVKLTVEPSVNLNDEVTLKIKVEVTRLGDQVTLQASPEIKQFRFGTRLAETTLMLKDDETVFLGGLIQDEDRKNRTTVPILGDIPLIGQLFTSTTQDRISTEVVLTITPRIVRNLGAPAIATQAFWSGTENTYATSQLFAPHATRVSNGSSNGESISKAAGDKTREPSAFVGAPPVMTAPSLPSAGVPPQLQGGPSNQGASAASMPNMPKTLNTVGTAATTQPGPTPAPQAESPGAVPIPPAASTLAAAPPPAQVASAPPPLSWRPSDSAAGLNQIVRLDVVESQQNSSGDTLVTITFDPHAIEFHRVGPGAAPVSSRAMDGKVLMTLGKSQLQGGSELALASLFVSGKRPGDHFITLEAQSASEAQPANPSQVRAVIHVK